MRVVVVGAGVFGLATARGLARRGVEVVVVEQGPIPNPLAASHDEHRLIRHPYGDLDGYAARIDEAERAWRELERATGRRLLVPTGTLALDSGASGWVERSARGLERAGIACSWIDAEECRARAPFLDTAGVRRALWLDTGGVLLAAEILSALAGDLARRGVSLRPQAQVVAIDPAAARVTLAGGEVLAADAVVCAAGAWTADLLPDLAADAVPSRQVLVYLDPPQHWRAAWARAPMVLEIGDDTGFYAVPPVAGTSLKIGDHRFSLAGHPSDPREAAPGEIDTVLSGCRRRLRDADGYRVARAAACYYTVRPGERFLLARRDAVWILTGFSGHGFKFGAWLGDRVAAAVSGEIDAAELAAVLE